MLSSVCWGLRRCTVATFSAGAFPRSLCNRHFRGSKLFTPFHHVASSILYQVTKYHGDVQLLPLVAIFLLIMVTLCYAVVPLSLVFQYLSYY